MSDAHYPDLPGHQATDTSFAAARSMDTSAPTIRLRALTLLKCHNLTPDEIAEELGLSVLTVRPRLTELKKMGLVVDTGVRRANRSGRSAAVFTAAHGDGDL